MLLRNYLRRLTKRASLSVTYMRMNPTLAFRLTIPNDGNSTLRLTLLLHGVGSLGLLAMRSGYSSSANQDLEDIVSPGEALVQGSFGNSSETSRRFVKRAGTPK